jgi:hypothetical protein
MNCPYNRISDAPVNGISQTQLASACLRVAASAEAGAFLISLKKMSRILESIGLFATTSGFISRASESQALEGSFLLP